MKPENKPLWYDVYEAFPPRIAPEALRPVSEEPLREIFYPEDNVRAMFYEHFGPVGTFDLKDSKFESQCQKFVHKFQEIKDQMPGRSEEDIFIITKEKSGIGMNWRDGEETDDKNAKIEVKRSSIDVSKLW